MYENTSSPRSNPCLTMKRTLDPNRKKGRRKAGVLFDEK
jgi:hypothetical protein